MFCFSEIGVLFSKEGKQKNRTIEAKEIGQELEGVKPNRSLDESDGSDGSDKSDGSDDRFELNSINSLKYRCV